MLQLDWDITVRDPGTKIELTVLRGAPGKTTKHQIKAELEESEPPMSTRRFKGEIATSRIDALGLAYKPLVTMHRLAYNLTDANGVLISKPGQGSAALRAGLTSEDVITAVEGEAVDSPQALETALISHLRNGLKAIDLTVSRGSYSFTTALKPYYNLKDQQVLVLLPEGESERLDRIVRELAADGATVTLAAPKGKTRTVIPKGLNAPLKIEDANMEDFDRLLLVEGEGAEILYENKDVLSLVKAASDANKIIAAEGASALAIPAADEALKEKKVTTRRDLSGKVGELQGQYTGQDVEVDGKILTSAGDGEPTTREFLKKLRGMR
jgi:putative intracellular protease/amidase